jgi:CDGSH-type Zn-finger protein
MSSLPECAAEPPRIRVYPDGPLLVRGGFSLLDEGGNEVGGRRKVVALCRCGRSRLAPLCDGSHQSKGRQPAS